MTMNPSPSGERDWMRGDNNLVPGTWITTYTYDYNNLLTEISTTQHGGYPTKWVQFLNNKTEIFRNCNCEQKEYIRKM
jgi:hypothetical protein